MRVAIVVRSLKIGGMERVAISLAEAFRDNQHKAHLIYFKNKKNTLSPSDDVKVHHFKLDKLMLMSGVGFFWEIFFRIFNIFLRKSYPLFKGFFTSQIFKYKFSKLEKEYGRFDLIIVRGQGTLEMIYQNSDERIVMVSENVFSYATMNRYIKSFQIKSLYENRNIVGVSSGVTKNLQELQKNEKFKTKAIVKITNPIDIQNTDYLANMYVPDFDEPFILSVGRVVPAKNIPMLIEAYHQAKINYNIKHKLVIVGDGSDMPLVKRRVEELSLEPHVHFTGQLTNPFPWMKKADLFILSSKFEGLGMVLLESIACSTKVIATKSRGGVT
ncbi:MAG: glycosyltransferase, partial [Campylobacterota bacterium]|nr:glycosyltransferase [Campylobacterota bacterium]